MIYTMWGSEIEIIGGNIELGTVRVMYEDGTFKNTFINELKADSGYNEIEKAINQINQKRKQDLYRFKDLE